MEDFVLVIDSGIGGLSIFEKCLKEYNGSYIYFSMSKELPLGNKSKKEIFNLVKKYIYLLKMKYNIKIVVLACNTITTSCILDLRKEFKDIVFVGTEPCIKLVKDLGYRNALVICTKATAKQSIVIKKYSTKLDILARDKKLAALIEQNKYKLHKVAPYVYKKYSKYKGKVSCVVLGCTHYAFVKDMLKNCIKAEVFDSSLYVASRLVDIVKYLKLTSKEQIIFCDSAGSKDIFGYFAQNSLSYFAKYVII